MQNDVNNEEPEALIDFRVALNAIEEKGDVLLAAFDALASPIVAVSSLTSSIADVLGDMEKAVSLTRILVFLSELSRSPFDSRNSSVTVAVGRFADMWEMPNLLADVSEIVLERLASLVESRHVVACSKALSLSFTSEQNFHSARIINDMRPLFDDSREEVLGLVSVQDLHIDYLVSGQRKHLTLSVDRKDIVRMKEMCEDALKKLEKLETDLPNRCGLNSIVAGDESHV